MQEDNCVFELTYNWGKEDGYSKGDAYAQVRPPPDVPPKLPHADSRLPDAAHTPGTRKRISGFGLPSPCCGHSA